MLGKGPTNNAQLPAPIQPNPAGLHGVENTLWVSKDVDPEARGNQSALCPQQLMQGAFQTTAFFAQIVTLVAPGGEA